MSKAKFSIGEKIDKDYNQNSVCKAQKIKNALSFLWAKKFDRNMPKKASNPIMNEEQPIVGSRDADSSKF